MQLKFLSVLLCLFLTFLSAAAVDPVKESTWVLSFGDDTPDSVVDQTVDSLTKIGAEITHKFSLIKGYIVKATQPIIDEFLGLDSYTSLKAEWKPTLEEDGIVTALGGDKLKA